MSLRPAGIVLAAAAAITVALAQPQTGGPAAPSFDVASIKPSGPQSIRGSEGGPGGSDPGLYRFGLASLLDLISVAYDVKVFQISSATPLDRQNFDLVAKIPDGATKQQFRAMLQNFLAERFHLKLHIQSKEFPAYELVIAKSGPKLSTPASRSQAKDGWPDLPPNRPGMAANLASAGGSLELVRLKSQ